MVFSDEVLRARRERCAAQLPLGRTVLIVGAGESIPLPENTDQTYLFRAHAEYFYLTGLECEGGVITYDPLDRTWHSFVPEIAEAARVWDGKVSLPGVPLSQLPAWLAARHDRTVVNLGAPIPGVNSDGAALPKLRDAFRHARRAKDPSEITLLRRAAAATAAGYEAIQPLLIAGSTERAIQIELEAAFFRAGAQHTGYSSIVGTGPNAAVLHFHPSPRAARAGEFILIDAGVEIDRYVCDVTRTYVAGGKPSAFQRDLYAVVLAAEQRAIQACRPGVEWKDIHLRCAVEMTGGLISMGLMRGSAESLVEQEAHTLFFPHGLGHLVGLGVRDGSGTLPGRPKDPRPSLQTLRSDFPLQAGYVTTVEPGLYFIPALLNDPTRRSRFRNCVNWPQVEAHLDVGGVRIEDNVLVTSDDPEILTAAIPKALSPAGA